VSLYVRVYIRSLHPLVRTYKLHIAFVNDSIGTCPKNATLLLHDALACLSASQTDHCHFTRRRSWWHCVATSTGAPALRALRVPRTLCGYPAPYHAARHQLVPCTIKSVLGFRAVQLTCRFTLLCAIIACFSYSYLRNVITCSKRFSISSSMQFLHFTAFLCCVGRVPIEYYTNGTWQNLCFWTDHDSTHIVLYHNCPNLLASRSSTS
jgi:hypothetical protein